MTQIKTSIHKKIICKLIYLYICIVCIHYTYTVYSYIYTIYAKLDNKISLSHRKYLQIRGANINRSCLDKMPTLFESYGEIQRPGGAIGEVMLVAILSTNLHATLYYEFVRKPFPANVNELDRRYQKVPEVVIDYTKLHRSTTPLDVRPIFVAATLYFELKRVQFRDEMEDVYRVSFEKRETGETQTARRYTYENIPQNMRISNTYTRVNGLIKQHHKMQYITYIYSIDVGITMISIR